MSDSKAGGPQAAQDCCNKHKDRAKAMIRTARGEQQQGQQASRGQG